MSETNAFSTAVNVFTSPGEAFAAIRERGRPLMPLILLMLGAGITGYIYMAGVDSVWFQEQQLRISGADLTEEQIAQTAEVAGQLPLAVLTAIANPIAILLFIAIYAGYLKLVSLATKDEVLYKQWFSLVCWTSLPGVLSAIATTVNLLSNDLTFMPAQDVNPLSFVNLFGLDTGQRGVADQIVLNLDVTSVWALILAILGYNTWTKKGLALSTFIVGAPYILLVSVAFAT